MAKKGEKTGRPWPKRKSNIPGQDITVRELEFAQNFIETGGNATEACRRMGSTSPKQLSSWYKNRPAVRRKIAELLEPSDITPRKFMGVLSDCLQAKDPRDRLRAVALSWKIWIWREELLLHQAKKEEKVEARETNPVFSQDLRNVPDPVLRYIIRHNLSEIPDKETQQKIMEGRIR